VTGPIPRLNSDLAALVTSKNEALEVEYKSWTDTSVAETSAKLARHLAALSNHGGGYLIFGVDDKSREPEGATTRGTGQGAQSRFVLVRQCPAIAFSDSPVSPGTVAATTLAAAAKTNPKPFAES
jgi:hypothetical protein